MENQKYVIPILLVIIVVLFGFVGFLMVGNNDETSKKNKATEQIPTKKIENTTEASKEETRSPAQPEVYLGKNIKIPNEIGCTEIGQYGDNKKPGQEDIKNSFTEELHVVFDDYILNGWMFQQACKFNDDVIAYSLYNSDRSEKFLSNNLIISFVEDKISLSYYLDEKIIKSSGSEICKIYELSKSDLKFTCPSDSGEKKYMLPFDQQKRVTEI